MGEPAANNSNSRSESVFVVETVTLTRRFGEVTALDGVSLQIRRGEFFSLLGPSGCGKTTLLRILAGLDAPDSGAVLLNGRDALAIPAHQRPVNTVFQSYALFPHLNVWDNVAFGLRMKKIPAAEVAARVRCVLEVVHIGDLGARKPHQLSGGQKQRVALARAIVNEPAVLLLDEPLAALDVALRRELQAELHALQRQLGLTFIHVTHDQDEALSLSDRTAVMHGGKIVQAGTPEEIYNRPRSRFVAQFVGGCNLIETSTFTTRNGTACALTRLGELEIAGATAVGGRTLALRPERILVGRHAQDVNRLSGVVREVVFTGPETRLELDVAGVALRASVGSGAAERFTIGSVLPLSLPPEALTFLED